MHKGVITIVSGLPRSGTSMMMQMIERGGISALTDTVREADADNPKGYYELEAVKKTRSDATWINDAPGKVVKVIHLLLMDLPVDRKYRVVFMQRDINEVIASQTVMLERRGQQGATLTPGQLEAAFARQLDTIRAHLAQSPAFDVLYVDYNALIVDPQPHIRAVNEFLGGSLDEAAMSGVVDLSLHRQRA